MRFPRQENPKGKGLTGNKNRKLPPGKIISNGNKVELTLYCETRESHHGSLDDWEEESEKSATQHATKVTAGGLSRSLPRQERENLGHQRQSFIKLLARTKSNRAWNVRKSPRAMPEADNLNLFPVVSQPVNDTVGTADDFAQVWLTEFRHHASDFRKIRQAFGAGDQFKAEPGGGIGIMLGDVTDDVCQIRLRRGGDDYLPAHEAILALTCSMGMPSPRSSDASPSSTACRNSNS